MVVNNPPLKAFVRPYLFSILTAVLAVDSNQEKFKLSTLIENGQLMIVLSDG